MLIAFVGGSACFSLSGPTTRPYFFSRSTMSSSLASHHAASSASHLTFGIFAPDGFLLNPPVLALGGVGSHRADLVSANGVDQSEIAPSVGAAQCPNPVLASVCNLLLQPRVFESLLKLVPRDVVPKKVISVCRVP